MSRHPRVQPGDQLRIPAETWNALLDFLDRFEVGQDTQAAPALLGRGRGDASHYIKNDSGAAAQRFGVLGIDGPIITESADADEYKARTTFKGIIPTLTDHARRFAVLTEPIGSGDVGRGQVAGVCIARVDIEADGDTRAGITPDDSSKLTSGFGPVEILHPVAGVTGETLCIVRLDSPEPPALAKITAVDQATLEISAAEVLRDATDKTPARTWDGGASPNLPKIKPVNPLDLPLVDDVVEVYYGPNAAGDELAWSCVTRNQHVRAKVATVDAASRTITAVETLPDGTARTDGRSFGTIDVESIRLPEVAEKLTLGYGYNATGGAKWFIVGPIEAAEILARVTSSATGAVNFEEVAANTFLAITDGLTGSASLPVGWQEMSLGSIVTVRPGPGGSFGVTSMARGVNGLDTPLDATGEQRNSGADPDWNIDDQGGTVGLQAIELGNLYSFDPKGFAFDLFDKFYTSEGVLQARNYRESFRLTGDADVSPALIGHVGMEKTSDDFGDETWRLFLAPPLDVVNSTITLESDEGDTTLQFDNSGRYMGGDVSVDLGTGLPILEFDIVETVETTATELKQTVKRYRIPAELVSTTNVVIDTIEDCGEQ